MAKRKAELVKEGTDWPARCIVALPYALALVFLGRIVPCVYHFLASLFTLQNASTAEDADIEIWTHVLLGIGYFIMAAVIAIVGTRLSEAMLKARTARGLVGLALVSGLIVGLVTLWLAAALLGKRLSWPADAALAAGVAVIEFLIALIAGWPSLRARRAVQPGRILPLSQSAGKKP